MCKYLGSWKCHRTVFSLMAVSNSLFYINTDVHIDILKANIKISSQTGFLCALWIKIKTCLSFYINKKKIIQSTKWHRELERAEVKLCSKHAFFSFFNKGNKERKDLPWLSLCLRGRRAWDRKKEWQIQCLKHKNTLANTQTHTLLHITDTYRYKKRANGEFMIFLMKIVGNFITVYGSWGVLLEYYCK